MVSEEEIRRLIVDEVFVFDMKENRSNFPK